MAHVKVLLFGPLAEAYGNSESIQEIEEGFNANQLLTKMGLSEWKEKGLRCAINQNFSNFDVCLNEGDEVVFLTPVSGG